MSVTIEQVRHLASLARLRFTEDEAAAMVADLSRMLAYVEQLQELDTSEVPPMAHALDLHSVFREDEGIPRLSRAEALSVAPATDGTYFRVPKVIE